MSPKPFKRKGCLISLFVFFLMLGLLYTQCAFAPTGYRKVVESNQPARQRLWNSRFAPSAPDTTESSPKPDSSPQVKPENPARTAEMFFQINAPENGMYRLFTDPSSSRWKNPFVSVVPVSASGAVLNPSDTTQEIYPSIRAFFEEHEMDSYKNALNYPLSKINDVRQPSPEKPDGDETVKWMDWMEKMLSEERWDRADFFDLTRLKDCEDAQRIFFSEKTCLALFRALRRGDPAKASQLIERYVQLSGKCFFVEPERWISLEWPIVLERFLFELASEPKAPEAMLERIATNLASWELSPQEYTDLQVANINRCHDLLVASLKVSLDPQYNRYWQSHTGWTTVPLKSVEKAGVSAAGPLLWQAIDRKAEALIRQDAVEYRAAHMQMRMAMNAIQITRKEGFVWEHEPDSYGPMSCMDLLEKNGLAYDWRGERLKNRGNLLAGTNSTVTDSDTTETQFSALYREESNSIWSREEFNRSIETIRFVFATARYHRDQGHYPDSVRNLIPRYLDESFAASPDREMTLLKIAPSDLIVLPEFVNEPPSLFTRLLAAYREASPNSKKWPAGIGDLKPYAKPGEDPTPYAGCFVHIEELPIFCIPVFIEKKGGKEKAKGSKTAGLQKHLRIHAMFPPLNLDGVPGYLPKGP